MIKSSHAMKRLTISPCRVVWRWLRCLVRRCWCLVSPKWTLIQRGPLTQHLMLYGTKKVGEQEARYEIEENRCGYKRYWVTEPGGWRYKINPSRLSQANADGDSSAVAD